MKTGVFKKIYLKFTNVSVKTKLLGGIILSSGIIGFDSYFTVKSDGISVTELPELDTTQEEILEYSKEVQKNKIKD